MVSAAQGAAHHRIVVGRMAELDAAHLADNPPAKDHAGVVAPCEDADAADNWAVPGDDVFRPPASPATRSSHPWVALTDRRRVRLH